MKKVLFLAAATVALAACNGADTDNEAVDTEQTTDDGSMLEGEEPGFEAVAPGTYEVTRPEGQVDYVEIHEGMTFSRVADDGTATGGVIFMKDGETCFLVEGEEEEVCFGDGERQPDGSMETVAPDGDISTVRAVEGGLEDYVDINTGAENTSAE